MKWREQLLDNLYKFQHGHLDFEHMQAFISTEIIEKLIEEAHEEYSLYSTYEASLEATKQQLRDKWL